NVEPDCVLVMQPRAGGGHHDVLFVEPNPGKTDSTFFTDRSKGELWVGPRLGVPETAARYGIHEARPLKDLPEMIRGLHDGGATRPWRILRGIDPMLDAQLPAQTERDKAFATALSEMRLLKDS